MSSEGPRRPRNSNYEVVDVDVSLASSWNDVTTHRDGAIEPPRLPSGDVITAKNTLQSFAAYHGAAPLPAALVPSAVPPSSTAVEQPTLPNGQVITGKNTLQSFAVERGGHHRDPRLVEAGKAEEPPMLPATVVAVAVPDDLLLVTAELAPPEPSTLSLDPGLDPPAHATSAAPPEQKGRATVLGASLAAVLVLSLALGLGLYFGLAAGKNGSTDTRAPTLAPTAIIPSSMNPTMTSPTMDPNLTLRAAVLTSYVNNITLSNQMIAANGTSPESQALAWMIVNDTTLDTAALIRVDDDPPLADTVLGVRISQRYALLTMWFQQNATFQRSITNGWLVEASECTWYGISCQPRDLYFGSEPGFSVTENVVTQVQYSLVGSYVGGIPADAGLLSYLEHFEIPNVGSVNGDDGTRNLHGTLPDSIGQWTALTYLDVSGNGLTGTLPESIGAWSALTYFNVRKNFFSGSLPATMEQWTAVTFFDAFGNGLSDLHNGLTGTLPERLGQWTALTYCSVGANALNGTLPGSIGQWTDLIYFDIIYNDFSGSLPDSIGRWTDLTYFEASSNALNGTLPYSIGQWTALTLFDVAPNELSGTLPASIGNWSAIGTAFFFGNFFVGTLPAAMCAYIDPSSMDTLQVDCTVNCSCCTSSCVPT